MRSLPRAALLAGLASALFVPAASAQVGICPDWASPHVNVSNDPVFSLGSSVSASDTGNLYVAWHSGAGTGTTPGIHVRRSTDGGLTWDPPVPIPDSATATQRTSISARGMTIDLVFTPFPLSGVGAPVKHARSTDGGLSFTTQTLAGPANSIAFTACVQTTDDSIYVLVNRALQGMTLRHVALLKSPDGGMTWSDNTVSNAPAQMCDSPSFDVVPDFMDSAADQISVAYRQYIPPSPGSVAFRQSNDGGTTWSGPLVLDPQVPGGIPGPLNDFPLSVSSAGERVAVVHTDLALPGQTHPDLVYRESLDRGQTFSSPINLTPNVDALPGSSRVLAVGERSYAYTQMTNPGTGLANVYEICVQGSTATRANPITPPNSNGAAVATNSSRMILAYNQVVGGSSIDVFSTVAPICSQLQIIPGLACPGAGGPATATATGDFCGTFNVFFTNLPPSTIGLLAIATQLLATPVPILGCPVGVDPLSMLLLPVGADASGTVAITASGPIPDALALFIAYLDPTSSGSLGVSLSELYSLSPANGD